MLLFTRGELLAWIIYGIEHPRLKIKCRKSLNPSKYNRKKAKKYLLVRGVFIKSKLRNCKFFFDECKGVFD